MQFRKFKATQLFDGYRLHENGDVLITRTDGTIEAIVPADAAGTDVELVEGLLTPGLINAHCHLELSHMKGVIPPHTGLIDFLCTVVQQREADPQQIQAAIAAAEAEMYKGGIVAVGDIGNTALTAAVKRHSNILWHNFTEVLSFTDELAATQLQHYKAVADELKHALADAALPHRTTLVPHAPYSISPQTFRYINEATANQVISIHNQEHPAEDVLYQTGGGDFLKLFSIFGMQTSPFPVTGLSSIRSVLPYFNNGQTILLVHNTYMSAADVDWANTYAANHGLKLVYCVCINANLYIEDKVPPVEQLLQHGCNVVLGTDSYSSNWQLSVAAEIKSLLQHTNCTMEQGLRMATSVSAEAMGWQQQLGSFEPGKRPGVVRMQADCSESVRLL